MLGKESKRIYLNIADGKILKKTDKGVERYDYVEGDLEKIYLREREFRGEKVPYWYLDLRDSKSGDVYTLGINANSGVWRGLIFCLGSEDFNPLLPLKIDPYKSGDYTRVSVYSGGTKLDWISGIPEVEEIEVRGKKIKSFDKRETFISGLVDRVNERIGQSPSPAPSPRRRSGGSTLSLSALMEGK